MHQNDFDRLKLRSPMTSSANETDSKPIIIIIIIKSSFLLYLNPSAAALGHGVRHGSPRGVNHRHQPDEPQPLEGKVLRLSVEGEAGGELVLGQEVVAEAEDSLAEPPQLVVGGVEGSALSLVHRLWAGGQACAAITIIAVIN